MSDSCEYALLVDILILYLCLYVVRGRTLEDTILDKDVEKLSVKASQATFDAKTKPSTLLGTHVGNMYTASLYGGLVGLLAM